MAAEVYAHGKPTIRRSLLLGAMFDVLAKADHPLASAEAVAQVAANVEFTPHEASLNKTGVRRAETLIRWGSSWATTLGWMTKRGGWALTEAGTAALGEIADKSTLDSVLSRRYLLELARRKSAPKPDNPTWTPLYDALMLLPEGTWTTPAELGKLVGLPGPTVAQFMSQNQLPNAHRVLQASGAVYSNFAGTAPDRAGGPQQLLEDEGVEFDAAGHATPSQRLTVDELLELVGEPDPTPSTRAWLVRGSSVNGYNLVPKWLAEGSCSLAASQLRAVEAPIARQELSAIVEYDYSSVSYNQRNEKIAEFDAFLNRMQIDDIVVTTSNEGALHIGRIVGNATYTKSQDNRSNLRRAVEWSNLQGPIDFADLPDALTARLSSQHTVVDLSNEIGSLEKLRSATGAPGLVLPVVIAAEAVLPDATNDLATRLLVDQGWIQEQIELLRDRRQLIFYGPPGTGKTYLAVAIAEHLTSRDAVKLVQFHPAYSYEDFFEGFRPSSSDGSGVTFKLSPGPFRRLVDAARENPSKAYILIIDEINRANLAKVFGELYFLLEYRGHAIDLLYSAGDEAGFTMPKNVYVIGTMNTADRSIALIDAAMRRRFAFSSLHPSEQPTAGLLGRWLLASGHSETSALVLDALNRLIEDEDFKIGPSYFMRDSVQTKAGLQRVWRSSIMPLLEEHHYGESIDVGKRYELAKILRAVAPAPPIAAPSGQGAEQDHDEAI